MFGTVKRIIDWCGSFKKNLYIGFVFSFFSGWFAAMPVIWAAYMIGKLVEWEGQGKSVSTDWIGKSIVIAAFYLGFSGQLDFTYMMIVILLSFHVFGSLEPIADCAHALAVIDDALDHLDALTGESFIDADGQWIEIAHYDIEFQNVDFSYGEGKERRQVLHNVNLKIPEHTVTAIVGHSRSGKSTICNLIARFYDSDSGSVSVGGHDVKEFTCDSLLSNISMVFQNVYLFHDTVRNNICFGKPDVTEEKMIAAAKKNSAVPSQERF